MEPRPKSVAVVLAGGITWGAFEAGALQVLAERRIPVRRIVAWSAGSLNGTVFAAGMRAHAERAAAAQLVDLWETRGGLKNALHPSLRGILSLRGYSDQSKLLSMLRSTVTPTTVANPTPIELLIIVAVLRGVQSSIDGEPAVKYTKLLRFAGDSFDHQEGLERVFNAATASAALPLLFVPVEVPGLGPCVDGGLLDCMPVRYARMTPEGPPDAVIVIAPSPAYVREARPERRGLGLLSHLLGMIFSERSYNALRLSLAENDAVLLGSRLPRRRRNRISCIAGGRRLTRIISIRPSVPLSGDPLSGFAHAWVRRRYIETGIERANQVLDKAGWR